MQPNARQNIILVHGAANSSAVWRFWEQELAMCGWTTHAIDLRVHRAGPVADLSTVSMDDYAEDVAQLANQFSSKPVLIGWSMGGLVALMIAALCVRHAGTERYGIVSPTLANARA
jgi:pimeloyl-ACP methyl ester carboxylesterase